MKRIRQLIHRIRVDERGEVEDAPVLVILVVGILFLLGAFLFIFAQFANANNQVQAAAFAAARDASLNGTVSQAGNVARAAAVQSLQNNIQCSSLDVKIDDSGLRTALAQTGSVSATVTCTVQFRTLLLPFMPSGTTIVKTAQSPIDPYRERTG